MASPANSRSSSPTPFQTNKPDSFRSSSPTHPIQIEHQIPNHPHLHIHTIRSPTHFNPNNNNHENNTASFEDELSPPSSISAQILAPFLNAPVPSSFKGQTSGATSNGHHSRGANARANALGSLSRSSSQKRGRRRGSIQNEDVSLTKEYMDLISENPITSERLDKIRTLASDKGIPSQLRKYVWPILLSQSVRRERPVQDGTDSDTEEKLTKISKRIRGELSRYHRRKNRRALPPSSAAVTPQTHTTTPPHDPNAPNETHSLPSTASSSTPSTPSNSPPQSFLDDAPLDLAVESTITDFLTNNPDIEYSPGMVYLALTLATWLFLPSVNPVLPGYEDPNILLRDTFAGALSLFGQLPSPCPMRPTRQNSTVSLTSVLPSTEASKFPATHRISQFLSAFRITLPELASYFDEEGLGGWGDDWVGGWVGWFCAKELVGRINDEVKARLWDVYFSYPASSMDAEVDNGPGEELHIYVCIALLKSCADALEVLEQSEIRTLLQQMPPVEDVEGILKEARRIKEQVLVKEREEEEGYLARRSSGGSHSGSQGSIMS